MFMRVSSFLLSRAPTKQEMKKPTPWSQVPCGSQNSVVRCRYRNRINIPSGRPSERCARLCSVVWMQTVRNAGRRSLQRRIGLEGFGLEAPRARLSRLLIRHGIKIKNREHPAYSRLQEQF
jgi:hypothetical protein